MLQPATGPRGSGGSSGDDGRRPRTARRGWRRCRGAGRPARCAGRGAKSGGPAAIASRRPASALAQVIPESEGALRSAARLGRADPWSCARSSATSGRCAPLRAAGRTCPNVCDRFATSLDVRSRRRSTPRAALASRARSFKRAPSSTACAAARFAASRPPRFRHRAPHRRGASKSHFRRRRGRAPGSTVKVIASYTDDGSEFRARPDVLHAAHLGRRAMPRARPRATGFLDAVCRRGEPVIVTIMSRLPGQR